MKEVLKAVSAHEWEKEHKDRADLEFSGHLVGTTYHGWQFNRPKGGAYRGEIVLCGFNSILVHGDIPDVVYRGGDFGAALLRLEWLATGHMKYLQEKVRLGNKKDFVHSVALYDLERIRDDNYAHAEADSAGLRVLTEAIKMVRDQSTQEEIRSFLYEESGNDMEIFDSVGEVVHTDIIWTMAAAQHVYRRVRENTNPISSS